jgi:hypothetical protein
MLAMKNLAACLFFLCLCGCKTTLSISLKAGETIRVDSLKNSTFHVEAEYPVNFNGDGCYALATVEADLRCGEADFTITDVRSPLLVWGHANRVKVTAF